MSKGKKKNAVVLLSGGIDSTVTLYLARKYGFNPFALIFNYQQLHNKEICYAVRSAKKINIPYNLVNISLPWGGSALIDRKIKMPQRRCAKSIPSTYVPARNIIFLSFAFSFAETIRANRIFIGAHIQDYSGYPDCRPEFLLRFQKAANSGTRSKDIRIVAPVINKNKTEIIRLGVSLGVDFKNTWSCYNGGKVPCCKCDSCRYRTEGFKKANLRDPLLT